MNNQEPIDPFLEEHLSGGMKPEDFTRYTEQVLNEFKSLKKTSSVPTEHWLRLSMMFIDAVKRLDSMGWKSPRQGDNIPDGSQGWIYLKSGVAVRGFWDSTNPDHLLFQHFTKLTKEQKEFVHASN